MEEKEEEELKKEEKKKEEEEKDLKGQVVDLPRPAEEMHPDKAKFLSEYDSRVKKETKAPPVPFKPGRVVADRPVPRTEKSPPPTPQEQKRVERKVMKLAMRMLPDLPTSKLQPADKGEQLARPLPVPRKGPRGTYSHFWMSRADQSLTSTMPKMCSIAAPIGIGSPRGLPGPTKKPISSSKSISRLGP